MHVKWRTKGYKRILVSSRGTDVILLLSFHDFTGYDTTSSFSRHGKKKCWKTTNPLLVKGIGRDGDLSPFVQFVCHVYGTSEQPTINYARLQLFSKAKKSLEMLTPTTGALEFHLAHSNHQAKIRLQEHTHVPFPTIEIGWTIEQSGLQVIWTRMPPIPDACLELVTCGCRAKCGPGQCTCLRRDLTCIPAFVSDAISCCNSYGQYT
ncbi:hypothetical protein Hamer_G013968 [Homarus americanus]|uniref:Uncharacterized protein n=1 Tax=Homarus americanus TaxID=6706 RepID=A0A8J5JRX8_HOMAM|nr:hypothetical protein Hamer_G013968 [Homarus americanus]